MNIEHAVIMAAGKGIRMHPFTNLYPKPMAPYKSSTLLDHVLSRIKSRVKYVHITAGYKKELFSSYVAGLDVSSIFFTEERGNSWWIYNTLISELNEPVYVFTCDNIADIDYDLLEADYFSCGSPADFIIPVKTESRDYSGDYVVHQNRVVTSISPGINTGILCSGIQIINPSKINQLTSPSDDFHQLWNSLIPHKNLMLSSVYPKLWSAIDTVRNLLDSDDTLRLDDIIDA